MKDEATGEGGEAAATPPPCLIQKPHPKGKERQPLGHRQGTGKPKHQRERVLRGKFLGRRLSNASSLETPAIYPTTAHGWP